MRFLLWLWLISASVLCGALAYRVAYNSRELARLDIETKRIAHAAVSEREGAEQRLDSLHQQLEMARGKVLFSEALLAARQGDLVSAPPTKSAALRKKLEQEPSYARFRRRDMRRNILQLYGDVQGKSTLPAEKLERLKQLLEERNYAVKDALEITGNSKTQKVTELGAHATMQAQGAIDAEIHELVGEAMYHDIKYAFNYRVLNSRVTDFENSLADKGIPDLSPAQRDALKAAYQAATYPWIPGEEKPPIIGGEHGPETDLKVERLVGEIFLPAQSAQLSAFHRDDRMLKEIYSRAGEKVRASDK